MRSPRYKPFVDKSVSAALSAIEIYNKPNFDYREETFSILMINAWELLLKAKVISKNKNKVESVYVMIPKIGKNGNKLSRKTPKLNRSGNPMTLGINNCLEICRLSPINLDTTCIENIELLLEIRDAAIHFQNDDLYLSKKVFEIGTATLRNYLTTVREWFNYDLSKYNFYLMPLSFYHDFDTIESFSVNNKTKQVQNLLKHIELKENIIPSDENSTYNLTLQLETKFIRSSSTSDLLVKYGDSPTAIEVNLKDEDIKERFPFQYKDLTFRLKSRYSDFKENNEYHTRRRELEKQPKYCRERHLDPGNPKSQVKRFYSSEILKKFDEYYSKKSPLLTPSVN
ncbi:uncharacterized protein DUF3644 [Pontibacter ummariensis]|uniref:DUF3644 domain-containing protein n=1 Tax=Pontibacter ummariensis TaxID=1610492 RepID=A0A239KHU2_9BACT|nr:DUF3644 domain-containing protein [Pontibacter ummariensis]PRY06435.1 uncharacterized protein DUF3644 [Pontibacter ummariensis]SNT17183.1 Protein of unknown function [Pontibacter ummariensis]